MFTPEILNTLTPNGMPPHKLQLKVGMIIMLLRNLNTREGCCNGTRLRIHRLQRNVIDASIIGGKYDGNRVFIPRILMTPTSSTLPFTLTRRQFPIRPCFAMTINKSQGQTLDHVGISLEAEVFTHGQLYVALSRVRDRSKLWVFAPQREGCTLGTTANSVYQPALL
jgi:ATP-dependent DNA helicase PIF1